MDLVLEGIIMVKQIMIIRHGEKPKNGKKGILSSGKKNIESLIVKGWIRAGALSEMFRTGQRNLFTPTKLYACFKSEHTQRALETIKPLSEILHIPINKNVQRGDEKLMAKLAKESDGVVLISWEHDCIHLIANEIVDKTLVPQKWPNNRYDMIYVFTLGDNEKYTFSQVPQLVLKGDLDTPFKVIDKNI